MRGVFLVLCLIFSLYLVSAQDTLKVTHYNLLNSGSFTNARGTEAWIHDQSLFRKYNEANGVNYNPRYLDVSSRWNLLNVETFDSLCFHYTTCSSVLPPNWNFTPTNSTHFFSIPFGVIPMFNGAPLPGGSYIGTFYLDGQEEKCGGYKLWTGQAGISVPAYGNDFSTPEKDGFDNGDNIIWKVFIPDYNEEYYALAVYNQTLPHHDGKFFPFGISLLTAIDAHVTEQQTLIFNGGWSAVSSYLQPKWKNTEAVFGVNFQQIVFMGDGDKSYYPGESIYKLTDFEMNTAYLVKSLDGFDLELEGISDHQQTIQLYAGWNLLPILSTCGLTTIDLLGNLGDILVLVKEIAGDKVYWPAKEVGSLDELIPGRAYFILLNEDAVLNFEDCEER